MLENLDAAQVFEIQIRNQNIGIQSREGVEELPRRFEFSDH